MGQSSGAGPNSGLPQEMRSLLCLLVVPAKGVVPLCPASLSHQQLGNRNRCQFCHLLGPSLPQWSQVCASKTVHIGWPEAQQQGLRDSSCSLELGEAQRPRAAPGAWLPGVVTSSTETANRRE